MNLGMRKLAEWAARGEQRDIWGRIRVWTPEAGQARAEKRMKALRKRQRGAGWVEPSQALRKQVVGNRVERVLRGLVHVPEADRHAAMEMAPGHLRSKFTEYWA
jgi:hypothetical protein